jgi:Tol biopolymer transport system component
MGEVYRAHDPRLGRDVAIKVLPESVARDPERLVRFEREARAVAALSHPNILSIFDFATTDGVTYAVTELLEGDTLRASLATAPFTARRAVEIAIPIAEGLAAAHDKGLVHRDLKPENVFVTTGGHVKILDFGLARPIAAVPTADSQTILGGTATTPGFIVGTIGYMAPEQVRGEAVDGRTDIFALGALLYELLTNDRAFKGATPADTMSAILTAEPPEARTREGALPPTLDDVMRRCLEKSPARRFQSAHDLAFALSHALGSSASFAAPAPSAEAPAPARFGRVRLAGIVGLVLALVGLGAVADRLWRPAPPLQPTFTALTLDSGQEDWPSLSPDGTSFVYVGAAAGNPDIYVRRIDGRNATNLTADSPAAETTPAYSPDGRFIAFRSSRNGGGLFVMEATGENVRRVSDQGYDPAWSPDGRTIAFATEQTTTPFARTGTSQLWVVDVAKGDKRKLTDGDAMQPSWSPDGRRIAVWSVDGGVRLLKTIAADGGAMTPVFPPNPNVAYWNPVWAPGGRWMYFGSNESGVLALGRTAVNARGEATGPREAIVAPAGWIGQIALSRDGQRVAYQAVATRQTLWRASFDPVRGLAGDETAILAGALNAVAPAVSPDGQTLAFSNSGTAAPEDIFTIDREGHHLHQLTDDPARDRGPAWSPDGSRLMFYTNRRGHYEVGSISPDGSDLRIVASAPDNDDWLFPRFSGGGQVSVVGLKASAILDATTWKLLTALPPIDDTGQTFWPAVWSPDHTTVAGLARSGTAGLLPDVILYRPATRQYQRLAGAGFVVGWLPDGKRLLVTLDRFYVLDLDIERRTLAAPWPTPGGSFSSVLAPDGQTLYYASTTTDADIWLMNFGKK